MNKKKICFFYISISLIVYVKCIYNINIPISSNEKKKLDLFKDFLYDNPNNIECYAFMDKILFKLKHVFNLPNYDLNISETNIETLKFSCISLKELYIEILRNFVYNKNDDQNDDLIKYSNILKKFLKKIYFKLNGKKGDNISIGNDVLKVLIFRSLSFMNDSKIDMLKNKDILKFSLDIFANYVSYIANENEDLKDINKNTSDRSQRIFADNLNSYKKNILTYFPHRRNIQIFFLNMNTLEDLTKMFYKFYTHFTNKKVVEKEVSSIQALYFINEILKIAENINLCLKENTLKNIIYTEEFSKSIQNAFKNICENMSEKLQINGSKDEVIDALTEGLIKILKDIYKDNKNCKNPINKKNISFKVHKKNDIDGFNEDKKIKLVEYNDANASIVVFSISNEMLYINQQHFANIKKLQHILLMCPTSENKKHILDNLGIESIKLSLYENFKKEMYKNFKFFFQFIKNNFDYLNEVINKEKKKDKLSQTDYIENDKLLNLLEKVMNFDKENNSIYIEKLHQFKNIMECVNVSISMNLENEKNPIVLIMKIDENNNHINVKINNHLLIDNINKKKKKESIYRDKLLKNLLNTSEINSSFFQLPYIYKAPLYYFTEICDKRKEKSPSGNWIRHFSKYNEAICLVPSDDSSNKLFPALVRSLKMNNISKNKILENIISEYEPFLKWYLTNIKSEKEKYLNVHDLAIFATMYEFQYFPEYSHNTSIIRSQRNFTSYIEHELTELVYLKNEYLELSRKRKFTEKKELMKEFNPVFPHASSNTPSISSASGISTPSFIYFEPSAPPYSSSDSINSTAFTYPQPYAPPSLRSFDSFNFSIPQSSRNFNTFHPTIVSYNPSSYTASSSLFSRNYQPFSFNNPFDSPHFSHSSRSQFKPVRPYDFPIPSSTTTLSESLSNPTSTAISTPIDNASPNPYLSNTIVSTDTPSVTDTIISNTSPVQISHPTSLNLHPTTSNTTLNSPTKYSITPSYQSFSSSPSSVIMNTSNLNESNYEKLGAKPKHRSSIRAYKIAKKEKEKEKEKEKMQKGNSRKTREKEKYAHKIIGPMRSSSFESAISAFTDKFRKTDSTSEKGKNKTMKIKGESSENSDDNKKVIKNKLKNKKSKSMPKLNDLEMDNLTEPSSVEGDKKSFQFPKETSFAEVNSNINVNIGSNPEQRIYENVDGEYENILKDIDEDGIRTYEQLVISELSLLEGVDINTITYIEENIDSYKSINDYKTVVMGTQLCSFPYKIGDFIKLYDMDDMIKHIKKVSSEPNKRKYFILKSNSYGKQIMNNRGIITKSIQCISKNVTIGAYSIWNNEFHVSNNGMVLKTETLEEKILAYYIERMYWGSNGYLYNDDINALQAILDIGLIIFEDGKTELNINSAIYGKYRISLLFYSINRFYFSLVNHIELVGGMQVCHTGYMAKNLPKSLTCLIDDKNNT
ncbi:conserved Plasmodium protein, unknown function [Plasmodium relictum]|uniref:Uncharacterized protein n=1 Tax=Plasmodium relictum TaxID=85471 RepID=A0A1J1HDC5_PLARL|nr:conserved Plasmodium protein, unknown function [Plasmodium relictum]CRH01587.1 conserved Plasmodium protein, unknown function [Plasmodium relictum]